MSAQRKINVPIRTVTGPYWLIMLRHSEFPFSRGVATLRRLFILSSTLNFQILTDLYILLFLGVSAWKIKELEGAMMRDYRAHRERMFTVENVIFVNFRSVPQRPELFRSLYRFGDHRPIYEIFPVRFENR